MVDTTLGLYVEIKRNIEAVGTNHLVYSVIVACFGENIRIFVSLDIINAEVEVH